MGWRPDGGTSTISIDGISAGDNLTVTFDSVAQFRASSGIPAEAVSVTIRGYSSSDDDGGASYLINRSDTTSSDDGVNVLVNGDGLRVKRLSSMGEIPVSWAGIFPDGSDHSTRKDALFAYALQNNYSIFFDQPGRYIFDSTDAATTANISHQQKFGIRGMPGVQIQLTGTDDYFLDFSSSSVTTTLTADVNKGDRTLSIASDAIRTGDIVRLRLANAANNSEIAWEQSFQVFVDSNSVVNCAASNFFFPSSSTYDPGDGATQMETLATIYTTTPEFRISNLEFYFDNTSVADNVNGFRAIKLFGGNCQADNLRLRTARDIAPGSGTGYTLILHRFGRLRVTDLDIENSGYSIWCQWSEDVLVERFYGKTIRHLITTNNTGNVTALHGEVVNGSALDAHGNFGKYTARDIRTSMPGSTGLDNIRAQGDVFIENCSFAVDNFPVSAGIGAYNWSSWANDTDNRSFFLENLGHSNLTIKDTTVQGTISGGAYNRNQRLENVRCAGFEPGEMLLGTIVTGRTLSTNNVQTSVGDDIILPFIGSSNGRGLSKIKCPSNPQNIVPSWVVDPGDSVSGNRVVYGLVDSYSLNMGRQYKWRFDSPGFYDSLADEDSLTVVLIMAWFNFPFVGTQQDRIFKLDVFGRLLHSNGGGSSNLDYVDTATVLYSDSGALSNRPTLIQNFSETRGSGYQPLSITAVRGTNNAGTGSAPIEPLPSELTGYTNLHSLEIDIDITVTQASGKLIFGLEGTTQFHPNS